MTAEQQTVFSSPVQLRLAIAVCAFFGIMAGLLLGGGKATLAACFGGAIACYFTMGQKFIVDANALTTKIFFRNSTFTFAESSFRIERLTGAKSWFTGGHDAACILHVTSPGKKEQKIALMLSKADTEALVALVRQNGTVVGG